MYQFLVEESALSRSLGVALPEPIRCFNLLGLGIDETRLINDIASSYARLPWDWYTVKGEQMALLLHWFPDERERLEIFFRDYYRDKATLQSQTGLLARLSAEQRDALESIMPFRRRSICSFLLTLEHKGGWCVQRLPIKSFSQATDDHRREERIFEATSSQVTDNPEFRKLITALAGMVQQVRREAKVLRVVCHQVGLVAEKARSACNAPEGIHQDGADFIVSALVIERKDVAGGTSRIYGPDRRTEYLRVTLEPGQGLFHADRGSRIWHDVTPITAARPTETDGVRNTLGFDIFVNEEIILPPGDVARLGLTAG